jgi:TolB-like protein
MAESGAGPSTPTIAVLPFDSPAADPGQEYLAGGFVEDPATSRLMDRR